MPRPPGDGPPSGEGGNSGQATVEFALLLPVLFVAVLGIVQVGLVAADQIAVVHAAREGARAAAVEADPARVAAVVGRVLDGAEVDVGARGPVGSLVEVEVRFRSPTRVPLVGALVPDPLLAARAAMRVER